MSDEEELHRELNWVDPTPKRDRRFFKTRPPGVNAMNAIAGLLWLIGVGLALAAVGSVRDLGAVAFCLGAVLLAVIAIFLSRRLWVGMGATMRAVLRPLGILGPLPLMLLIGIGGLLVINVLSRSFGASVGSPGTPPKVVQAPQPPPPAAKPPPPPRPLKLVGEVKKPEVLDRCAQEGPGWVLASGPELARAHEAIQAGQLSLSQVRYIWARFGEQGPLYAHPIQCVRTQCTVDVRTTYSGAAWVLCAHQPPHG